VKETTNLVLYKIEPWKKFTFRARPSQRGRC